MGHSRLSTDPNILTLVHPFCRTLACSKRCGKKTHWTRGYLKLNIHPSPRTRKVLPGVHVIIAASRHNGNERHCAYSNDSRHHNSTPKRTPVTNTYIKMYEHVMLSDVASSLSQRSSRIATKQLRALKQRATSQLQGTHYSHSQHTGPICYR